MKNKKIILFLSIIIIALLSTAIIFVHNKKVQDKSAQTYKKQAVKNILKDSEFYYLDEEEQLAPYYELANKKKQEILNSQTTIIKSDKFIAGKTYTGTAYYISPNGEDFNNGRSPETPIKTIKQLNRIKLNKGDAVFFERGYTYRTPKESLKIQSYVTYSAYGKGSKPVITRVAENSANEKYWHLYYLGPNGEKIWKYYKKIGDVAGIVFDDTTYAKRILEWPTPKGWLALNLIEMKPHEGLRAKTDANTNIEVQSANKYNKIEDALTSDNTYISRIDIENLKYPFNVFEKKSIGELYLRHDKGNPGNTYKDINIISVPQENKWDVDARLITSNQAKSYVLDNIALKYFPLNAIWGNISINENVIIQNCEIQWGGNVLYKIENETPTNSFMMIGDGIYHIVKNATINNNYIYQNGNALVFEDFDEGKTDMGTFTITGNVIENCGQGLRLGVQRKISKNKFEKIIIRDNIILNSGDSMNNANLEEPVAIDLGWTPIQYAKDFDISNNVMLGSTMALMRIPATSSVKMNIYNNVFAQKRGGILLTECEWVGNSVTWYMYDEAKD